MVYEEGDIILCTVERIESAAVFVKLETGEEGSISLSEVAPGRIRNIREYVFPNKKIVCKVLKAHNHYLELSLRRVTSKERKEILEAYQKEKMAESLFKTLLKEKAEKIINEITKKQKLIDFLEQIKQNLKELERLVGKEDAKKIHDALQKEKEKKTILKKEIELKSGAPNGIEEIRSILACEGIQIKYYAAGRYTLLIESKNPKEDSKVLQKAIDTIEQRAKKANAIFAIK